MYKWLLYGGSVILLTTFSSAFNVFRIVLSPCEVTIMTAADMLTGRQSDW